MGTNFYWKDRAEDDDWMGPAHHLGKRSAAGRYCWDCRLTLCKDGIAGIHQGRSEWHEWCPRCGQQPATKPDLTSGAAAVELEFAEAPQVAPTGVGSCASFTWAQEPGEVRQRCEEQPDAPLVEDEYGRVLTGGEFLRMLEANCPIEFTDMVGRWFS